MVVRIGACPAIKTALGVGKNGIAARIIYGSCLPYQKVVYEKQNYYGETQQVNGQVLRF